MPILLYLILFLSLVEASYQCPAGAQSIAPASDGTGTSVTPNGDRYDIGGGRTSRDGRNLFHSFQKFGLSPGEIANFLSNPAIRNIFGRVTGGNASIINGLIQVTGGNSNLFLMNPAGIVFGANASLNVPANFTATTATGIRFGNDWFKAIGDNNWADLVGEPSAFTFNISQPGAVREAHGEGLIANFGDLSLSDGRNLTLIGGTVLNAGSLSSPGGNITISAVSGASLARISQTGHLLSLEVNASLGENLTANPVSLPELLTGNGMAHATGVQVNNDGSIVLTDSGISVTPQIGDAIASGSLDVGAAAGGNVNILGARVAVIGANINASGINGGGAIRIGGDYRGQGSLPNATRSFISRDSTINADGGETGNGGRVIVWADEVARFYGNISARGGKHTGNGGFVEISAGQNLIFDGTVNVSAVRGNWGTVLLDPTNILISNASDSLEIPAILPDIFQADLPGNVTINATALENLTGNIVLEATNDIAIASGLSLYFVPGGSITFAADSGTPDGAGSFSMDVSQSINAPGRNVTISGANVTVGNIRTFSANDGGAIALTASQANIITGTLDSRALDAGAGGNITLIVSGETGFIDTTAGELNARSQNGNGGAIALATQNGDILTGNLLSNALGAGAAGNITLTINGEIGNINTRAGSIGASSQNGNGGAIALSTNGGNITTGNLLSAVISGAGTGGNIDLSVKGGSGAIDTHLGDVNASSNKGNGGAISLTTADGNIVTRNLTSVSNGAGSGGNITLTIRGENGAIATTSGSVSASSFSGKAGDINFSTAGGNIATGSLNARSIDAGTGGAIALSINGGTGAIDASEGDIDVSSFSGNGGTIQLTTSGGNITVRNLSSRALETGNGGNISLNIAGETGAIATAGSIDASSVFGKGGNVEISAPVRITTANINAGDSIRLTGNEIELTAAVQGTGTLDLQPFTTNRSIEIGGNANANALEITASELAHLNGFSAVTIGRENGSGTINIGSADAIDLNRQSFDLTLRGGKATFSNGIILRNSGTLTLYADTVVSADAGVDIAIANGTLVLQATGSVGTPNNPLETSISNIRGKAANLFLRNNATLDIGTFNILKDLEITLINGNLTDSDAVTVGGNATFTTLQADADIDLDNLLVTGIISLNTIGEGGDAFIVNNAPLNLGTSNIGGNLSATATIGGISTSGNISAGGDITLTGDAIAINRPIRGKGNLALQPLTPDLSIGIGTDAGIFNLNNAEIAYLSDGFTSIRIGRTDSSGDVTVGTVTFRDPLIVSSPKGKITATGAITGEGDAAIQLIADSLSTEDIITQGQAIILNSNNGSLSVGNLTSNGGAIFMTANSGIAAGNIDAFAVDISGKVTLSTLAEDIEVASIRGGDIEIAVPRFFRATAAPEGISIVGTSVAIRHGGGDTEPVTPFTVGSATINGTVGAIATASDTLLNGSFPGSYDRGTIQLITTNPSPTPTPPIENPPTENPPTPTPPTENPPTPTSPTENPPTPTPSIDTLPTITPPTNNSPTITPPTNNPPTPTPPTDTLPTNPPPINNSPTNPPLINNPPTNPLPTTNPPLINNPPTATLQTNNLPIDNSGINEPPLIAAPQISEPPVKLPPEISLAVQLPPVNRQTPSSIDFSRLSSDLQGSAILLPDDSQESDRANSRQPVLAPFIREGVERLLDAGDVTQAVSLLDVSYTQEVGEYVGRNWQSDMQSFPKIQERLRQMEQITGTKAALIYVFARSQQLDLILVSPDGKLIYEKGREISREKVIEVAKEFRDRITDPRNLGTTNYQDSAKQLYEWLVAPLEKDLQKLGINTLMFSLDSGLRSLPLSALYDGQQFLVQKYSVALIPSFSLVTPGYESIKDARILAMGASEFADGYPLPAVPIELKTIAEDLWAGKSLLNKDFTLNNFEIQRREENVEIIHIATHAEFKPGAPENSYIQLWDRKLRMNELEKLDWYDPPVELLVLSACRTAVGDRDAELGFAGLAVQAGARTAIASLWYVSDIGTLALMSEFYYHLHNAPIKVEALRQAQIAMIRGTTRIENGKLIGSRGIVSLPPEIAELEEKQLNHPFYWSAFTAIGSPW